uniref:Very-long-chain (3R)-3-hydroxyacyl-CoA dehydratase n=1 Tax=Labrus bergylta TaxID=56723 RepID=A0A3Q3FG70_9LABR
MIISSLRLKDREKTSGGCEYWNFRLVYIFSYNLFQFCGHTWILANTIARFLTFGKDALADTFYSVGVVMSLCQLLSILELFHIADVCVRALSVSQVVEKNLLLVMVVKLEEIQSKPVVCVLLFLWNILDLLRYPHELLCVMEKPSGTMLWTRYTLWIPVYVLSAATEGDSIFSVIFFFFFFFLNSHSRELAVLPQTVSAADLTCSPRSELFLICVCYCIQEAESRK